MRPTAQGLMQTCLNSWHDRHEVSGNVHRWSSPPDPKVPNPKDLDRCFADMHPGHLLSAHRSWAACYNMVINKRLGSISASDCPTPVLVFAVKQNEASGPSFAYHLAVEKVRTSRRLLQCSVLGRDLHIQRPLKFANSIDVIASYWGHVKAGRQVQVFVIALQEKARRDLARLAFLGPAARPELIVSLARPSSKMQKKLVPTGADADGDERLPQKQPLREPDGPDGNKADDSDAVSDAVLQHGLNLLMEEAEATDPEFATYGDNEGFAVAHVLQRAVNEAQSAVPALDELDEQHEKLSQELQREVMEQAVGLAESQRARDALSAGTCAVPAPEQVQAFIDAGHATNDDFEAALELVLNESGAPLRCLVFVSRCSLFLPKLRFRIEHVELNFEWGLSELGAGLPRGPFEGVMGNMDNLSRGGSGSCNFGCYRGRVGERRRRWTLAEQTLEFGFVDLWTARATRAILGNLMTLARRRATSNTR